MNFHVYNRDLSVDSMQIGSISSSSILLVGDTETIQLASIFDTPAESLLIGSFVPLNPQG